MHASGPAPAVAVPDPWLRLAPALRDKWLLDSDVNFGCLCGPPMAMLRAWSSTAGPPSRWLLPRLR
eukprot:954192-Karenia_brevis.AAC.1